MWELTEIIDEVHASAKLVREADLDHLTDRLLAAPRVFLAGAGRTGLMTKAFAMRLMHLGRTVYAAGETITPAITGNDLLLAASCSGNTVSVLEVARRARSVGSAVYAVTAAADSPLIALAHDRLVLPARAGTGTGGVQFGNSLFEQLLLMVLDAVILRMQRDLHETPDEMSARHANLE